MNHKQKLGYTFLGAGIMAVGIIIGQFITPNIEAQNNGYFDKITCRELEVVDKDGKKAIVLQSDEKGSRGQVNRVVVYDSQNKGANVVGVELVVNDEMSEVRIEDKVHNITSVPGKPAILLSSNNYDNGGNRVVLNDRAGVPAVMLYSTWGTVRDNDIAIFDTIGKIKRLGD